MILVELGLGTYERSDLSVLKEKKFWNTLVLINPPTQALAKDTRKNC